MQVSEGVGPQNKWIYMMIQELYVNMALSGIAVGLAIAFAVLLLVRVFTTIRIYFFLKSSISIYLLSSIFYRFYFLL